MNISKLRNVHQDQTLEIIRNLSQTIDHFIRVKHEY